MKLCQYIISLIWGIFVMHVTSVCCDMPSKDYTAYRLYKYCSPSDYMRYPSNVSDVVAIVNEATSRNVTVKAFGARHSQTDLICTFGIPVDMNKFKSCIMNPDGETASFGPGVTIKEAGEFLLQNGRARRTTPAFGGITIGGAIGTGAHGSSIKYTSQISSQVVRMTVVNGLGQIIIEIDNPEDLKSFKVLWWM